MKLLFSGHETFACRLFWLKKGYDFIKQGGSFSSESAMIELGVGKNMVPSIRYWMKSFGLLTVNDTLTELSELMLDEANGLDPYLENGTSLWLLFYNVLYPSNDSDSIYAAIFPIVFKSLKMQKVHFSENYLIEYIKKYCTENDSSIPTQRTLAKDVSVFLKSMIKQKGKKVSIEDGLTSVFQELELVKKSPTLNNFGESMYEFIISDEVELNENLVMWIILKQFPEQKSISLHRIERVFSSMFLLSPKAFAVVIESLSRYHKNLTITSDAGIKELQIHSVINKEKLLRKCYV